MIFVTVGTTRFEALVKEIDRLAPELKEKIVIQTGHGTYIPKNCEHFKFAKSLQKYYDQSDLVITHGGAGILFELANMHKKVIGVSDPDRPDNHQKDLLTKLTEQKVILWCKEINQLKAEIIKSKKYKFKKYIRPKCTIAEEIVKYV